MRHAARLNRFPRMQFTRDYIRDSLLLKTKAEIY